MHVKVHRQFSHMLKYTLRWIDKLIQEDALTYSANFRTNCKHNRFTTQPI